MISGLYLKHSVSEAERRAAVPFGWQRSAWLCCKPGIPPRLWVHAPNTPHTGPGSPKTKPVKDMDVLPCCMILILNGQITHLESCVINHTKAKYI